MTILPFFFSSICGKTRLHPYQTPSKSTEKHFLQSSSLKLSGSSKTAIPALLIIISGAPKVLTVLSTINFTDSSFATSVSINTAFPCLLFMTSVTFLPFSELISAITTFAPSWANLIAVASPIPEPAPVIIATLSCILPAITYSPNDLPSTSF